MAEADERAERYRQLVIEYEALGEKIQELIRKNGGNTKDMTESDMVRYRELAAERDEKYDQIKHLEAEWLSSDESDA